MSEFSDINIKNIVAEGDFDFFKTRVEENAETATSPLTEQGSTPLMIAAAYGHMNIIKYLILEKRIDINTYNMNGTTALVFACNTNQIEVVAFLCSHGADVECVIDSCDTPLTIAAAAGHVDIVACLCGHSANVEHMNGEGQTALHCAVVEGHREVVGILLQFHANVNALTSAELGEYCCTPLLLACKNGHVGIVKQLLQSGGDPSVISESILQHIPMTQRSAIIDILTSSGWLPVLDFRRSCEKNDATSFLRLIDVYPSLLRYISQEPLPSAGGANAVMLCSLHGSLAVLRSIFDISKTQPDVLVDMHVSSIQYHHIASFMRCLGMTLQARSNDGRTALSYAAWTGKLDVIEFLVQNCGLDVDSRNERGESSLLFACSNGHKGVVSALVNAGASKEGISDEDVCANLYTFKPDDQEKNDELKSEIIKILFE